MGKIHVNFLKEGSNYSIYFVTENYLKVYKLLHCKLMLIMFMAKGVKLVKI